MAKEVFHVVPHDDGWAVKREGVDRASSTHDTQKSAIEAARETAKEGDDVVIHRTDGSIRDRVTHGANDGSTSNGNGSEHRDSGRSTTSRPQAHDVWSVGSRISWPAIFAGVVVAMAVSFVLTNFATATGLSTMQRASGKTILIFAGIAYIVTTMIALFLGGLAATRLTTRETKGEAAIYGLIVWGTCAVLLAAGLGSSAGMTMNATRTADQLGTERPFWHGLGWSDEQVKAYEGMTDPNEVRARLNLNDEQMRRYEDSRQKSNEAAASMRNITPQEAAWWTLLALLLSMASAIGGALVGSGPELSIGRLRNTAGAPPANSAPLVRAREGAATA